MHVEADKFLSRIAGLLRDRRRILEIGAREVNGSVRHHFPFARRYVGIDLLPGPGVDVVADFVRWRSDERFDTILCIEVLEHAPDIMGICRNALAHLEPGGVFVVTAANHLRKPHSGVDGGEVRPGEYYACIVEDGLRNACKGFANILIESAGEDIRGFCIN